MGCIRLVLALAAVLAGLVLPGAVDAQVTQNIVGMEEYTVSRVNRGRDNVDGDNPRQPPPPTTPFDEQFGLAFHGCITNDGPPCSPLTNPQGLRKVARDHATAMAAAGTLDVGVTSAQVATASPDPAELNGPPDDGFGTAPYTYCVNVGRTSPIPNSVFIERSAVDKMYEAWRDDDTSDPEIGGILGSGGSTSECIFDLTDRGYTAAAAGWAKDHPDAGHYRLWVALVVIKDTSPNEAHVIYPCEPPYCPGPSPTPSPTPTPTPTPSGTPTPTPTPTPVPTATPPRSPTPVPTPFPPCSPRDESLLQVGPLYVTATPPGLWQETNGWAGLQRESGLCPDGTRYQADQRIVGVG